MSSLKKKKSINLSTYSCSFKNEMLSFVGNTENCTTPHENWLWKYICYTASREVLKLLLLLSFYEYNV